MFMRNGTSVCWQLKTRLDSGPVTADLTTIFVHSSKLVSDIKYYITYYLRSKWEEKKKKKHWNFTAL